MNIGPSFFSQLPGGAPKLPDRKPNNGAKDKKPGKSALAVGIFFESASSLALTNARFNTQRNAAFGLAGQLKPKDYVRGGHFFCPARLVQFFSMVEAKTQGNAFSNHMFPDASPLTHDLWGAIFSTMVGLPFSLPMDMVLIKGIQAGHEKKPFPLFQTVKDSCRDTLRGNIRGTRATLLRDLPYGGCAVALPGVLARLFEPHTSEWSEPVKKPVFSLMAAFLYTVGTNPVDVTKTAIQNNPNLSESVWKTGGEIVRNRGWLALTAGFPVRFFKIGVTFFMLNSVVPALDEVIEGV